MVTGSVFLYTDNDDFFAYKIREQDPLYALQPHLIYTSPQRWWVSLGAAHDRGGESSINGDKKDDERRDLLYGISAGLSIGSRSSVKPAYVGSRSHEDVGKDGDSIALAFSTGF
jgi:hypothetical protein